MSMERLTNHFDYCKFSECKSFDSELRKQGKCKFFDQSIEHCYEKRMNDKLRVYEDLEEQGMLKRLPFKVGDVLWTNNRMQGWYFRLKDAPYRVQVVFIGLNDSGEMGGGLFNVSYENYGHMLQFNFSDIGKTIFLTKEEAEEALKRMDE